MGLLRFQYVVSFSSQDDIHTVEKFMQNSCGTAGSCQKRWLCSATDKSGRLEAEFQLQQASTISYIDVGNYGSATVEIQVGRSSWPRSREYIALLPAVTMMTLSDCKMGNTASKTSVRMFTAEHLNKEGLNQKWDRIRVICCQPFLKNTQFGLCFLRIGNIEDNGTNKSSKNHLLVVENSPSSSTRSSYGEKGPILLKCTTPKQNKTLLQIDRDLVNSNVSPRAEKLLNLAKQSNKIAPNKANRAVLEGGADKFQEEVVKFLSLQNVALTDANLETLCSAMEKRRRMLLNQNEKADFYRIARQICGQQQPNTSRIRSLASTRKRTKGTGGSKQDKQSQSLALQTSVDEALTNIASESKEKRTKLEEKSSVVLPVFDLTWSDDEDELFDGNNDKELHTTGKMETMHCLSNNGIGIGRKPVDNVPQNHIYFVECPVCLDMFPTKEIESHAAHCGMNFEDETDVRQSVIPINRSPIHCDSSEDAMFVECPICEHLFENTKIAMHADQCAEYAGQ